MHVVVIGAGIAGLGAAFELRKQGIEVTLVEQADEVGGRCRSFAWHGHWFHTGAEALMRNEPTLTTLRAELAARGAAATVDLDDWDTVHGERLWHRGDVLPLDPFSLGGAVRLPGGLRGKARLAALLPLVVRHRRRHDPADLGSAAWLDDVDGATWFRSRAPRLFDDVIEPFVQYTTLGSGDYGLAWLIFNSGDLGWMKDWWGYAERGSGGVTYELGRVLGADEGCTLRLGACAEGLHRTRRGVAVTVASEAGSVELAADAAVVAVPGDRAAALVADVASEQHLGFLRGITYVAHHFARYRVAGEVSALPRKVLLPSAAGFTRVAKISRTEAGEPVITAQVKDTYARTITRDDQHDDALEEVWDEAVRALPALAGARVIDRVLTRNDVALCRRPAGFAKALAAFEELPPIPRVALAGDYLLNSTVGCAHRTGVHAAHRIAGELAAQRGRAVHG